MTEATPLASEQITKALSEAFKLIDNLASEMNGAVYPHDTKDTDDIAMDLADAFGVPFNEHWASGVVAALSASPAPSGQGVSGMDRVMHGCEACDGEDQCTCAAPAPSCAPGRTASQCSAQEVELAALLAEVELELRHSRVFIGSREKMHPTGIELYEQLHAKVNAALDALR